MPEDVRRGASRLGRLPAYTVKDLAQLWQHQPSVILKWLQRMREDTPPTPGQIRVKRLNRARRHLLIRDDYAQLLEQRFILRSKYLK